MQQEKKADEILIQYPAFCRFVTQIELPDMTAKISTAVDHFQVVEMTKTEEQRRLFRSYQEYVDRIVCDALKNAIGTRCLFFQVRIKWMQSSKINCQRLIFTVTLTPTTRSAHHAPTSIRTSFHRRTFTPFHLIHVSFYRFSL